jgi:hypothetical protein
VVTAWLILLAAFLTAGGGVLNDHMLRRLVDGFRNTRLARMVFGQLDSAHGSDE